MKYCIVGAMMCCLLAGCSNKLSGSLTVDGSELTASECRSGEVYGFVGVELVLSNTARLRVAQSPTNEGVVFLIPTDGGKGVEIGACGELRLTPQNSTINDIRNVEGQVALDCTAEGHTIKGSITFENCH